jgi:hypothetical protein
VPYAVALYFDEAGEAAVRRLWSAIEEVGIPSLATVGHGRHVPHLTLKVSDEIDVDAARGALAQAASTFRAPQVTLGFVGVFAGRPDADAQVVVAGAVLSDELLGLHALARKAVSAMSSPTWDHYLPSHWVPHCTLAMPVRRRQVGPAIEAVLAAGIPLTVRSAGIAVADVATGDITEIAAFAP